MSEELRAFQAEVARFQAWADAIYPLAKQRYGEWETHYDHWNDLEQMFDIFVSSTCCHDWDDSTVQIVLYVLARDNEAERMIDVLAMNEDNVLCLAAHAVESSETEAKWQFAQAILELHHLSPLAENLLLRFARDDDEYVRRRAMSALAYLGSPHVLDLVHAAWDTGEEYQRISVLCALHQIGSPLLAEYAARAEADGQQQGLLKYATYIREHGTLSGFTIQGCPVVDLY